MLFYCAVVFFYFILVSFHPSVSFCQGDVESEASQDRGSSATRTLSQRSVPKRPLLTSPVSPGAPSSSSSSSVPAAARRLEMSQSSSSSSSSSRSPTSVTAISSSAAPRRPAASSSQKAAAKPSSSASSQRSVTSGEF